MDDILAALRAQHDELDRILAGLADADWNHWTRCDGWTVADVVIHLAQTHELAAASATGQLTAGFFGDGDVDGAAASSVESERGVAPAALLARWRAATAAERDALAACDPSARLQWITGDLAARTLATTRLAETWIHTGDVAVPLGIPPERDRRLWHIARLAWRTLPYAFGLAAKTLTADVGMVLVGPDGDAWEFGMEHAPATVVRGPAIEFCLVAGRRLDAAASSLTAEGPDAENVLALVRTYA